MAKKIQAGSDEIKIENGMFQTSDGARFNTHNKALKHLTELKKNQVIISNNSKNE